MSEICESIINDYLSGALDRTDFEEGLSSIFAASGSTSTHTQGYLQQLFTQNKINAEQFRQLSETVSKINIQLTLTGSQAATDISYFDEDKTLHLTDVSESEGDNLGASDQTVIIRTDTAMPVTDYKINETAPPTSPSQPQIKLKKKEKIQHKNLGPGVTLKDRFVLLERLGQGGMGVVFKAKDLLKVEAQDKDPYVAIKVLTEAFKK